MSAPRRLCLIRHAKAEAEAEGGGGDYERRLAKRGRRDAKDMGRRLAASGLRFERIVASAAPRAAETAERIARAFDLEEGALALDPALYLAGAGRLLTAVQALPPGVRCAALVAHNPDISRLAALLVGERLEELPTCGVARLELRCADWSQAGPGSARLLSIETPER